MESHRSSNLLKKYIGMNDLSINRTVNLMYTKLIQIHTRAQTYLDLTFKRKRKRSRNQTSHRNHRKKKLKKSMINLASYKLF